MNRHDVADRQVVPAQFIAFALACALVLFGSLFPSAFSGIAYKLADAVFITGCVLVAMKLVRKGWDLPAAGYTVLSIAWGMFFLAKDFRRLDVQRHFRLGVLLPAALAAALAGADCLLPPVSALAQGLHPIGLRVFAAGTHHSEIRQGRGLRRPRTHDRLPTHSLT